MLPMLNFLFPGAWTNSPFSDLPELKPNTSETLRHFCVVAGGIALVLSRLSESQIRTSYPATQDLYKQLRSQIRRTGKTNVTAEMLSDVMHEVTQVVDAQTRVSLKACYEARAAYEAKRRGRNSTPSGNSDGAMTQSPQMSTRSAPPDHDRTVMQEDLLVDRADVLRQTVANARRGGGEAAVS